MRRDALDTQWTWVAFGDVVRLSGERSSDPEKDGFDRFIGLDHIDPEDLRVRRWGHVQDGTTFTSVFRPGQVLFGKRRAYQRKVAVADFSGVCSGDIYVLEPASAKLVPELLPFICQTEGFFEHAIGTSAGSLSPRTNWASLAKYEFALPSLAEQSRILSGLRGVEDTLSSLAELGSAAERLRDSLCRELLHRNAGYSRRALLSSIAVSRPGLWGQEPGDDENDVHVLRSTDLSEHGLLDAQGGVVRSIPERKVEDLRLRPGDIFLEKSGGGPDQPVGRVGFVESDLGVEPVICGNFIQLLRVRAQEAHPEWLFWLLFGLHKMGWTLRHQTQTTGIRNLQVRDYLSEKFPLPPITKQAEQAREIRDAESGRRRTMQRQVGVGKLKRMMLSEMSGGGRR